MTIKQQITYVMEHPFYGEALRDPLCMEKLLFEVMFSTYQTVSANCAKAYRGAKRMNGPQIVEAIRDIEPPINLDVRLPIPAPRVAAVVVPLPMQVVHRDIKIRYPKVPNPMQLSLTFGVTREVELLKEG